MTAESDKTFSFWISENCQQPSLSVTAESDKIFSFNCLRYAAADSAKQFRYGCLKYQQPCLIIHFQYCYQKIAVAKSYTNSRCLNMSENKINNTFTNNLIRFSQIDHFHFHSVIIIFLFMRLFINKYIENV